MSDEIKEGDFVSVSIHNSKYTLSINAEVLHCPRATGDSWRFRDVKTMDIHYVSEGCTVSKRGGS
jgi:hypothetical protein